MKNSKFVLIVFGFVLLISSCDDIFMDRNPKDRLSPQTYFKTENELRTYVNRFYTALPEGTSIFAEGCNDIMLAGASVPSCIRGDRTVPVSGGGWSWGALRNINFFLDNVDSFSGDELIKNRYEGIARFFRAYYYFEKVKRFGDVPWYSTSIESDDEELIYKERDPRSYVMDKVLEDLDFAIQYLGTEKSPTDITRWTALALKSRAMLFEGTFGKYHGISDYERFLEESISASLELMQDSDYFIFKSNPESAYFELFIADDAITDEIILAREYNTSIPFNHNANFRATSGSAQPGLEKRFVNTYLMKDGSRFTDLPDYDKKMLYEETQNRDPRLSQTVRTPGYKRLNEDITSVPQFDQSYSGYQLVKYIVEREIMFDNQNDLPIFRYAEVLLNYAEAKAELGTLNQTDLDISVKLLRDRVGMPGIDMASVNANPDPYLLGLYNNVTGTNAGVILEIRRERGIELVAEGHRWWDLMRWREGKTVERTSYGMYFPGPGEYDLYNEGKTTLVLYDGEEPVEKISGAQYHEFDVSRFTLTDGMDGGYMIIHADFTKSFDETRDYLYPIPIQELTLNSNLVQNPGW